MATNDLGRIQPIPQGDWDALTAYEILDIVNHNDSSWISTGDSVNSEPADGNANWQLLGRQTSSAGGGTRADQEVAFAGSVAGTGSVGSRTVYELNFAGGPTTDFSSGTVPRDTTFTIPVRQNFMAATVDPFTGRPTITVSGLSDEVNGTYEQLSTPLLTEGRTSVIIFDNANRRQFVTQMLTISGPNYTEQNDYFNIDLAFDGIISTFSNRFNSGSIFVKQSETTTTMCLFSIPSVASNPDYQTFYRFSNGDVPAGSWVFAELAFVPTARFQTITTENIEAEFAFDASIANITPPFPQFYPHPTTPEFQRDVRIDIPNFAPTYLVAIQDSRSITEFNVGEYQYVDGHTESQDREALLNFVIDYANNTLNITPQWSLTFDAAGDSVINTNQTDADRFGLDLSVRIFPNGNGSGYMPTVNGAAGGVNTADVLNITYSGITTEQDTITQQSDVPIDATFIAHNVAAINAVGQNYSAVAVDNNTLRVTSNVDEAATITFEYVGNSRIAISSTQTQTGGTSTVSGTAGLLIIDGDNVPVVNGDSADIVAQRSIRAVDNPLWTGSIRGNTKAVYTSVDTGPRSELPITYTGEGLTFTTTFTNGT